MKEIFTTKFEVDTAIRFWLTTSRQCC